MRLQRVTLLATLVMACPIQACAQAAPPAPAAKAVPIASVRSEWVTLGTAGGPQIRKRSQAANALIVRGRVYLFDTGAGTIGQMAAANLSMRDVAAIFISHHHIDHNADLGQLIPSRWMFNTYTPLPIIGPPGTIDMMTNLAKAVRPVELAPIGASGPHGKPSIASTIAPRDLASTIDTPTEVYRDENIRVLAITNTHYNYPAGSAEAAFARSYSYRIEAPDRTFLFTGDTGPSRNVELLGKGADVLISEVIDVPRMTAMLRKAPDLPASMLENMIAHMEEDHLTPVEVGKMATAMGVKEVVLTHIVPGAVGEADPSSYIAGVVQRFSGRVRLANDLDRF